jgi:hypothetical protein
VILSKKDKKKRPLLLPDAVVPEKKVQERRKVCIQVILPKKEAESETASAGGKEVIDCAGEKEGMHASVPYPNKTRIRDS